MLFVLMLLVVSLFIEVLSFFCWQPARAAITTTSAMSVRLFFFIGLHWLWPPSMLQGAPAPTAVLVSVPAVHSIAGSLFPSAKGWQTGRLCWSSWRRRPVCLLNARA